jgi:hypothetical protein
MIFFIVALVLLLAEILVWWLTSPLRKQDRFHTHLESYSAHIHQHRPKHTSLPGLATSKSALSHLLTLIETVVLCIATHILPRDKHITTTQSIQSHFSTLQNLPTRNWLQRAFFTPLECFNAIWACYLIFAQTIGAFNNCACMTSSWGSRGGYLDFTQYSVTSSPGVQRYWVQGTVVTGTVMGVGMGYIVLEVG